MGTITELQIHDIFDNCINSLKSLNPDANEMNSVKTKLDEAEAMAKEKLVGVYPDDVNAADQANKADESIQKKQNEIKQEEALKAQKLSANPASPQDNQQPQYGMSEQQYQDQQKQKQQQQNQDDEDLDQPVHDKHTKKKH